MQTLNVGAGRTDSEYQVADEQRRADLLAESRYEASYLFGAAGAAALGTGLLPMHLNIFVSIGAIDLLRAYGGPFVRDNRLVWYGSAVLWVAVTALLGVAAQRGHRWAFLAGIVLYGADMIALIMMFSMGSFGIHAFFLFRWFQGQKALQDLKRAGA